MERASAMKKPTVRYSKGEIGRSTSWKIFLPSGQLVLREDNVKVTLSCRSARYLFKRAARQRRVPYQRMIRRWWTPMRRSRKEGVMRLSSSSGIQTSFPQKCLERSIAGRRLS